MHTGNSQRISERILFLKKETLCLCLFISHSVTTGLALHCCTASLPLCYHGPPAAFYGVSCCIVRCFISPPLPWPPTAFYGASSCILRGLPLHCTLLIFLRYPWPPTTLCAASFPSVRVPFTYKALGTHAGHRKCELNEHRRGGAGVMAQSGGSYHTGGLCLGGRDWQIPGAHCQPAYLNHQVLGKSKRPCLKKQSGQ